MTHWTPSQTLSILVLSALGSVAAADPLSIHQNDAIKVVFQTDLRADVNRPGDRFVVKVVKDPGLPKDTTLEGRITRVHFANPYRAASMDMVFTNITLPNGTRFAIDAVPTPVNDPHLTRGTDGRLVASYKPGEEGAFVVGGTVGGLILGGIGHRPILGAFIGGLIGSIAGATNRQQNANLVVRKGETMAALFEQDVAVSNAAQAPPSNGWRHQEDMPFHPKRPSPPVPPANQSSQAIDIKVGSQTITFDTAKPFTDNNVVMVPVETMADQLNFATTVHDSGAITIDGPDTSAQVEQDSTAFHAGTNGQPLPHKVVLRDGVVYVPIQVFARMTGGQVTVNGSTVNA